MSRITKTAYETLQRKHGFRFVDYEQFVHSMDHHATVKPDCAYCERQKIQ